MLLQVGQRRAAGGHRQNIGPDRATTLDVQRRVANDNDFLPAQLTAKQFRPAPMGRVRDLIPLFVVVGKCARDEFLPQIEVPQLDLCAKPDISREQTERRRIRQRLQIVDQFPDAGTGLRFTLGQNVVEPEDVALEEAAEMFGIGLDVIEPEKFAHQTDIRAAGELHFLCAVWNAELQREHLCKCLDACAARVNERAINVEEDEFDHLTQGFDGGFEARCVADVQHLRFLVEAFHEAG